MGAAFVLGGCSDESAQKMLASGIQRIAQSDFEGARLDLKTALQADPQSPEARFMLGKVLHATGDHASAEIELRRARELGFAEQQVVPLLASALLGQGKTKQLLLELGQYTLSDPQADAELLTHLAAAEADQGHLDRADARTRRALEKSPHFTRALLLQAKLTQAGGNPDAALAQVQALIARDTHNADAWFLKAELHRNLPDRQGERHQQEAYAALAETVRLRPDHVLARAQMVSMQLLRGDVTGATELWTALHQVAPRHFQTVFLEAVLAARKGDYDRVHELTQILLRGTPDDPRILLLAGQAEFKRKALLQAEMHFARAAKLAPGAAAPRRWLARVHVRGGHADKALALLRPLADATPPDLRAIAQIAEIQLVRGDYKAAGASYARIAKVNPADPLARTGVAVAHLQQDRGDAAALGELEAIAGSDAGTMADFALIGSRLTRNDLDGARRAVKALTAKMPAHPLPDHLLGRIALQTKDRVGARMAFEKALAKDADYMPSLAGLAALDLADAQPAVARKRFEALLSRQPQHTGAMLALAELSARSTNRLDEAVEWLAKAIKSDPNNPVPRQVLIDQLWGAGRIRHALDAAQAAVAALPGNSGLTDRLGRLQLLAGEHRQAVSSFNTLAGLMPKAALPLLRLADVHAITGDHAALAAAMQRAAQLEPDAPAVLQAQATLAKQQDKPDVALALARRMQKLAPNDAVGYALEGDVELRRQRYDAAAQALRKAVTRSQPGESLYRLHAALFLGGRKAEAAQLEADHRQRYPGDVALDMHLGDLAVAARDLPSAERHYQRVLERNPSSVITLNNLAHVQMGLQRGSAVATAEKALALAPGTPAFMDTLARCLAAERQLPRAITVQTQAVAAAPGVHQYRLHLAQLYLQAGDTARGRGELERLAAVGTAFAGHGTVVELLNGIKP